MLPELELGVSGELGVVELPEPFAPEPLPEVLESPFFLFLFLLSLESFELVEVVVEDVPLVLLPLVLLPLVLGEEVEGLLESVPGVLGEALPELPLWLPVCDEGCDDGLACAWVGSAGIANAPAPTNTTVQPIFRSCMFVFPPRLQARKR